MARSLLEFDRVEPPSVPPGSRRGAEIAGGPLAAALRPSAVLFTPPPVSAALGPGATAEERASSAMHAAHALAREGFCVCHGALEEATATLAAREAAEAYESGRMEVRGFMRGGQQMRVLRSKSSNRGDLCAHLGDDDLESRPGLAALDEALEDFARRLLVALAALPAEEGQGQAPFARGPDGACLEYRGRGDLMVACYPGGGSAHGVHIDNVADTQSRPHDYGRVLTLIACAGSAPGTHAPQPDCRRRGTTGEIP